MSNGKICCQYFSQKDVKEDMADGSAGGNWTSACLVPWMKDLSVKQTGAGKLSMPWIVGAVLPWRKRGLKMVFRCLHEFGVLEISVGLRNGRSEPEMSTRPHRY